MKGEPVGDQSDPRRKRAGASLEDGRKSSRDNSLGKRRLQDEMTSGERRRHASVYFMHLSDNGIEAYLVRYDPRRIPRSS